MSNEKTSSTWRRRLLVGLLAVALLALAWTVGVGWWLPRWLQPRIEAEASRALGAPFTLERIEIAPWRLEARVLGARLGPRDKPWLQVAEVHADVSSESVWRRAPVLRRLTVRAPAIELERLAPDRYNVTPLLDALAQRPPADSAPLGFAVHNIRIEGGAIHLVDRVGGSEHRIDELRVGIPFLSNLPSQLEVDVEPQLDARVDGSRLHLQGQTLPFTHGLRSTIDLRWQQIDVAQAFAAAAPLLLPRDFPLALQKATLDLALQIGFERRAAPAPPSLHIGGSASVSQLEATLPARGVHVAWQQLALEGLDLRPLERRAVVGAATLRAPAVEVELPRLLAADAASAPDLPAQAGASAAAAAAVTSSAGSSASLSAPAASSSGPAASSVAALPSGDGSAWQWRVERLALEAGRVLLRDPAWPEGQLLSPVQAAANGLGGDAGAATAFTVEAADAAGGKARLAGTLGIAARRVVVDVDTSGLQAASWSAPWRSLLPLRLLDGQVALRARLEADGAGWSLSDGQVQLAGLDLAPAGSASASAATATAKAGKLAPAARALRTASRPTPSPARSRPVGDDRLRVAKAELAGLRLRSAEGRPLAAAVEKLRIDGLDLRASRGADGSVAWLPAPAAGDSPRRAAAAARAGAGRASPPRVADAASPAWQLGELQCRDCAVALSDRHVQPATSLAFTRGQLTLRRLGSDPRQPVDFDLSAGVGRAGRARAKGTLRLQPLALRSRVDLAAVDLGGLQPYLDPYVNLQLVSAKASAAGDLRIEGTAREAVASAQWRGRLGLGELRALDRVNDAEFLRFRSLGLEGADIAWRPSSFEADLGMVILDGFYGRVIINPDGRINLRDILRRDSDEAARSLTTPTSATPAAPPAAAPATPSAAPPSSSASPPGTTDPRSTSAAAPPPSAAASAPADAPTPLRWRGIRLTDGEVDFSDNFIRPNYSARLTGLSGDISALAWNDPAPAQVRITAELDRSAPVEISGTMHPLGPRLHTDITANARGVDMTRLSAYAARYAGYGIEKGTLTAKVHYRVDDGKLQAENNLYLDQLTFGQKVESPDALKVPVLLAVSLLKDRNGVIDINLPISGSLDDPQFSLGGIIVRVIVNLVVKAVTAPFTLLSNAFGGGKQELSYAAFDPGVATIGKDAAATLDTLARALADRPALKLEITGRADPAEDVPALRRAHLERLLRIAKARATGTAPDDTTVEPGERERWLEAAYRNADLKDKPRNAIGFAKTIPAPEMEALLLRSAPAGPDPLKALADGRADRVKAWLSQKVPPERLLVTASKLDAAGIEGKGPTTRVDFSLK